MDVKTVRLTRTELQRRGMVIPEVKFRDRIREFVKADRARPPAPGGILFLGDSDIRFWNDGGQFDEDFAGLPAINRGFGGARTWETLIYFAETVLPCRPRLIVYCCGDNDIARLGHQGVASAVTGFRLFLEQIKARAPFVEKILYMGIHPSPGDEPLWGFIKQANARLRPLCKKGGLAEFVDYNHLLLDAHGRPRPKFFRDDGMHFAPGLYRRIGKFLRPKLKVGPALSAKKRRNSR
jgi:hypothetical protein